MTFPSYTPVTSSITSSGLIYTFNEIDPFSLLDSQIRSRLQALVEQLLQSRKFFWESSSEHPPSGYYRLESSFNIELESMLNAYLQTEYGYDYPPITNTHNHLSLTSGLPSDLQEGLRISCSLTSSRSPSTRLFFHDIVLPPNAAIKNEDCY